MGALNIEKWQAEQILRHKWAIAVWLAVNLLDSVLTFTLLRMGGEEVWFVYPVVGSIFWTTVVKWSGVALVVGLLVRMNRPRWLWWFTLAMVPVALWNLGGMMWLGCIHWRHSDVAQKVGITDKYKGLLWRRERSDRRVSE